MVLTVRYMSDNELGKISEDILARELQEKLGAANYFPRCAACSSTPKTSREGEARAPPPAVTAPRAYRPSHAPVQERNLTRKISRSAQKRRDQSGLAGTLEKGDKEVKCS